jgi:hypothetical protein
MRSLLLIAVAACSASSAAPLAGQAPTRSPAGPPPTIAWGDHNFVANGLPAVSSDGSLVVLAVMREDGARGNPNLAIVVINRRDAITSKGDILTADDADRVVTDTVTPELHARIAGANDVLARIHAGHDLVPLDTLFVDDSIAPPQRHLVENNTMSIDWKPSVVEVRRKGQRLLDRDTPASWLAKDTKMCPHGGCTEICHNPAFLDRAWASADRAIAVLKISYEGTDTCWEPPSEYHVVAW